MVVLRLGWCRFGGRRSTVDLLRLVPDVGVYICQVWATYPRDRVLRWPRVQIQLLVGRDGLRVGGFGDFFVRHGFFNRMVVDDGDIG